MSLISINPATGQPIREYQEISPQEAAAAVERAHAAFTRWRGLAVGERCRHVAAVGSVLRANRDTWARLISEEMGKPLAQSAGEVEKCAALCDHHAAHAPALLAGDKPPPGGMRGEVIFQPLGVLLAVMPWNFPFWQAFRAAVPALLAGNTVLLKHSSNVCGCALAIERAFAGAGLPEGAFQTLLVGSAQVKPLMEHPLVRAVTLTGSTAAGRAVAAQAGAALKKSVVELGGSDPYLILEDADLDHAAEICAAARLINSGQSCIAGKRFIVVESVREAFVPRFVARMAARRVGPPLDPATHVGPLARADIRGELDGQVRRSIDLGAELLLGGRPLPGPGYYYPPTVLGGVARGMPAWNEELFGPVAAVISARDEEEAVALANDTAYGLGSAVFTRDAAKAARIARSLEAGVVFVNDFVKSDPALPFGGVKESGYGRELGAFGIREFVNVKTIVC